MATALFTILLLTFFGYVKGTYREQSILFDWIPIDLLVGIIAAALVGLAAFLGIEPRILPLVIGAAIAGFGGFAQQIAAGLARPIFRGGVATISRFVEHCTLDKTRSDIIFGKYAEECPHPLVAPGILSSDQGKLLYEIGSGIVAPSSIDALVSATSPLCLTSEQIEKIREHCAPKIFNAFFETLVTASARKK